MGTGSKLGCQALLGEVDMKILNFGSLNIDYTYAVPHFVKAGETLSSSSLDVFSGGKGLNQSIAFKRCGVDIWHAGAVGEKDGGFLIEELKAAGINTDLILKTEGQTGHAVIQKEAGGDNCILLYGGANQSIPEEWVDKVIGDFGAGDWLVVQNEINHLAYIMEKAYQVGMKIVLNPSPMNDKVLGCPLQYVDYFILNEVEAETLCPGDQGEAGVLESLQKQFPKAAFILTLGSRGSLYRAGVKEIHQVIYQVPVVDTTAAGDTFTGYFFGSLVKGIDVKEALAIASKAASMAVSKVGAVPSIPFWDEVMKDIN